MINARLKSFKINIPSLGKDEDVLICENYTKTTYLIVIPSLNWGYKLLIETSYEEMKKNMIDSFGIYSFLPSDVEDIVMGIFYILFGNKFEESTNTIQ